MAFKPWNPGHIAKFNSAVSADFLSNYEEFTKEKVKAKANEPSHQTFAGSAFRCDRKSWFRIRGVQPDSIKEPDMTLNFSADIGTACHRIIQTNLKEQLGDDWLSVSDYLFSLQPDYDFIVDSTADDLECRIEIKDPPIMFACDGLIRFNDKIYLLEIKTSEFNSWNEMTDPKPQHIDQVKCYATLLNVPNVLFLYQDRQYGGFKCYEFHVTDADMFKIKNRFKYVMDMVRKNLAPEALPKDDTWCNSSMCPYFEKCKEYGR